MESSPPASARARPPRARSHSHPSPPAQQQNESSSRHYLKATGLLKEGAAQSPLTRLQAATAARVPPLPVRRERAGVRAAPARLHTSPRARSIPRSTARDTDRAALSPWRPAPDRSSPPAG